MSEFNPQFAQLGEILVHNGCVTEGQLNEGLAQQKSTNEKENERELKKTRIENEKERKRSEKARKQKEKADEIERKRAEKARVCQRTRYC